MEKYNHINTFDHTGKSFWQQMSSMQQNSIMVSSITILGTKGHTPPSSKNFVMHEFISETKLSGKSTQQLHNIFMCINIQSTWTFPVEHFTLKTFIYLFMYITYNLLQKKTFENGRRLVWNICVISLMRINLPILHICFFLQYWLLTISTKLQLKKSSDLELFTAVIF